MMSTMLIDDDHSIIVDIQKFTHIATTQGQQHHSRNLDLPLIFAESCFSLAEHKHQSISLSCPSFLPIYTLLCCILLSHAIQL